jgi:polyhydroxyalkanoate synthesis regulator phasin
MQMSTSTTSKKKVFAVAITTVALTAGSFGVSQAATKSTKATRVSVSTPGNPSATGKIGRGEEVAAILSGLVTKGTITQAQADAIIAAHTAAEAARDALRPPKGHKDGKGGLDAKLAVVASTLGIDSATVMTRLKAGETLAAIAGAKTSALIAALVADETKRIDAAVTAGKLTAAQATTLKAGLVAHVTEEVNSVAPLRGPMDGKGDKGGRGGHGPRGGHGADSGAPVIPAPTN